jgi:hypothetical protein
MLLPQRNVVYDYYGVSVKCRLLPGRNATYVYYVVDQELSPTTLNILAMLSRHFLGNYEGYYNDYCSMSSVYAVLGQADPRPQFTRAQLRDLPKPKISGDHHIHFTANEIYDALERSGKHVRAKEAFRLRGEVTTSFVGGVMLWLASLPDTQAAAIINSDLLDQSGPTEFMKLAKKLSVQAKSLQNLVPEDLRYIFEVDVLVNRCYGSVDWAGEKKNRVEPNLAQLSEKEVYEEAVKLFTTHDHTAKKPRNFKWDEFWEARWQWSAAGSIHSQYPEDVKDLPKDRALKNKFILLSTLEKCDIGKFTNRKPEIHAWSSTKYEWGKMRAIYGTDLTSYVLSHFAFFNCEDTLPARFPVGDKARPSFVSASVSAVLEGTIPLCVDFEDFNSQHSNDAMAAVVQAYIDSYASSLSPEQILAAQWTKDSISRTVVHDNMGTGTTYDSKGTLMSGWRLTTYINSVLNYIYTQKLVARCMTTVRSVHNGDDVLAGITNMKVCTRIVRNAERYNIRLQRKKCAFGGLAEFLRVDHMRGSGGQYLSRNVATLMHSRIESKLAVSIVDVVDSMEARLAEFVERGGDRLVAANLRHNYYERMAEAYGQTTEDLYTIKVTHRVAGGISERPDAPVKQRIVQEEVTHEVELPQKMPGITDYSLALRRSLDLKVDVAVVVKRVKQATLNAVQMVRRYHAVVTNDREQQYMVYRALNGAYSDIASMPLFGKAMLTGFVFDVLSRSHEATALSRLLSSSRDPMTFLRVLT